MPKDTGERPPKGTYFYASAELGINLLLELHLVWLIPFYAREAVHGASAARNASIIGLGMATGRVAEAVSDPVVGHVSDKTRTSIGRRLPYVLGAALPWAAASWFCYHPPGGVQSPVAPYWGSAAFIAFSILSAILISPYLAMMPDIARGGIARVKVSVAQSVFRVAGVASAALGIPLLIEHLGYAAAAATCSAIALVSIAPIVLGPRDRPTEPEDEPRSAHRQGLWRGVAETFQSTGFRAYAISFGLFWVGLRTAIAAVPFLAIAFLGIEGEGGVAPLLGASIAVAVISFPFVPALARRVGRGRLFIFGMTALGLSFPLMVPLGTGLLPGDPKLWFMGIMAAIGVPAAVLFTVPYTILADVIDEDAEKRGTRRDALFFGVQGLILKLAWGVGDLITTQCVGHLGATAERPTGLYVIAIASGIFGVVGGLTYRAYQRRQAA
ncbi:MAG: MFS transporter [Armatimonadia bacterium]|nr:MFS transporter [Armatimonadia bacterium]